MRSSSIANRIRVALARIADRLPGPERWRAWIPITIGIKLVVLALLHAANCFNNDWAGAFSLYGGDTTGYFDPVESLLNGRGYAPDYRMPGYGAVYLPLRTLLGLPRAYDALALMQFVLAAYAMYVLARLACRFTGSSIAFLLVFMAMALCMAVQWYDPILLTESFCASALILFVDRVAAWYLMRRPVQLLQAGAWLAWAIFLKPVIGPVAVLGVAALWLSERRPRPFLIAAAWLLIPFVLADAAWMLRNWTVHSVPAPLTRTLYYSDGAPDPKLRASQFVIAFGGDMVWWSDPQAEVRFFNAGTDQVQGRTNAGEIVLPDRVLTSVYTMDSLRAVSSDMLLLKDPSLGENERRRLSEEVMTKLEQYRLAFIEEHPIQYHVLSRWMALARYWDQTGLPFAFDRPFAELPLHAQLLKLFYRGFHWVLVLGGIAGALVWWRRARDRGRALLPIMLVPYGLLVFPLGLRFSEHRYLVPFTPFLILACVVGARAALRKPASS